MEKLQYPERNVSSPAVTERNLNMHSNRRGYLGGQDAIEVLEQTIEESSISHYYVSQVLSKSDPTDYKLMCPRICYVLSLTVEDQNKHTLPLVKQLLEMPLDELICHCWIVFEETENSIYHESK